MTAKKNTTKKTAPSKTASKTTAKITDKDTSKTQKLQIPTFISVESTIGAISILAMKSQTHKYLFLSDYEWLILPAIATKQFALFRGKQNEPIAFISWASVSKQVEKRLTDKTSKLQPADWNSGDIIYIIDIICPFGPSKDLLRQLNGKQFKGKDVKVLRPKAKGKGVEAHLLNDILKV
jgi:cytolysin-activating lysine-acyltransferase